VAVFAFAFDDLLLMPAALPVVLWIQRLTGLRNMTSRHLAEMFSHVAIWSVMCKIVARLLPHRRR